ncbi:MAG: hypothetical protein LIO70_07515 [Clostridiales bacterium]|nr:hypothetical protein [Clostridiales bacterium]
MNETYPNKEYPVKVELLSPEEALERGRQLPYALIRCYSSVTLRETPEHIALEEVLEARFFNATEEARLFRQEGALRGAACEQVGEEGYLEERYKLANDKRFGEKLTVRRDLWADEDGQTYVVATRLAGWQGGAANEQ